MKPFLFTLKPQAVAIFIYIIGWIDFKKHLFGDRVTVGHFFMLIAVWILISWFARVRNLKDSKNKNIYFYTEEHRRFAGFAIITLPLYTLIYWIYNYKPFFI